jgi:hypothetical protein
MVPLFVSSGRSLGVAMIRRVIAVSLLLTLAAHARPPETADPALAPWFQQLHQPRTGAPCCSVADCRPTSFRQGPDGYEALIDDKWGCRAGALGQGTPGQDSGRDHQPDGNRGGVLDSRDRRALLRAPGGDLIFA